MQTGNLTVEQQINRENEEKSIIIGREQLNTPPIWLIDDVATNEYKRIVLEMEKINVIGNLDYNNVGAYCNAFSNYIKVTEELKGQDYALERETRTGNMLIRNPLIDIQTNYANEMRKFASTCGLTIDSRLKAATTTTTKSNQEIDKKYGNI
jgi:P27 family predicted phage terminase small subunit